MPLATPGGPPRTTGAADDLSDDTLDLADTSGDGSTAGTPVLAPPVDPSAVDRHHVTRIDIEASKAHPDRHPTHGWQVRARRAGARISKFFADSRFGSADAALGAALVYRDRLLASLPDPAAVPRRAWSNTGVVGLSVRKKSDGPTPKLYVQLNWIDASGRRRASSYSVDKWGLRRALWNGCLRLYRERAGAGAAVEEPHVMFARAQEPFGDILRAELAADQAREALDASEARAEAPRAPVADESPERRIEREEQTVRRLEDVLFG